MHKNTYPTIRLIFDRRHISSSDKVGNIDIEIYFNKTRKWVSTGVQVLPRHWNDKKRVVGRADSSDLNLRIETTEKRISSIIRNLMMEEKPFSWEIFASMYENTKGKESFIRFVEKTLSERQDIRPNTRRNHKKFLNALKEFGLIKSFSDITKIKIQEYDKWLRNRRDYLQSTIATYHKYMKCYINLAKEADLVTTDPYTGIRIDRGKNPIRRFLTEKELFAIERVELPTKSLNAVRDVFVFQCYTGLAYADLKKFDFNKVIEKNGKYVVHDKRQKTGEEYYIVLLPKAIEILKRYNYVLPLMTNQQYNMRLKILADSAGLDKNLTSHMGRHTYATLCINKGISVEILAKMLGHSDIKTTQVYAKLVNKTVESAYEKLEKLLEG